MINKNIPLVVITGPTASGKTSLAIELALQLNGEIICADSRTIYKGMDIGTAKPTDNERVIVPHWGLDLVEPNEYYSVSDFKDYALLKIADIRSKGKIPFLVGGTGLYIDSVIFDYKFGEKVDEELRSELQHMTLDELYSYCEKNNVILPENFKNKRYIIRSIEKNGCDCKKSDIPISTSIIVGITTDIEELNSRIKQRTEQLITNGVITEAELLSKKFKWSSESMKSNIYPLIHSYLLNEISIDQLKVNNCIADRQLAKRQITWLKRNKFIHWLSLNDAKNFIIEQLAMYE